MYDSEHGDDALSFDNVYDCYAMNKIDNLQEWLVNQAFANSLIVTSGDDRSEMKSGNLKLVAGVEDYLYDMHLL